jgi:hypothetical protein
MRAGSTRKLMRAGSTRKLMRAGSTRVRVRRSDLEGFMRTLRRCPGEPRAADA